MVLIGINVFLRGDKIMDLGFLRIFAQSTACDDFGFVAGLFTQVSGKTEKSKKPHPIALTSWTCETCH